MRKLLFLVFFGLLPLAVQGQGVGQDMFQPQRPATVAPTTQIAPTTGSLVSPSIGNAAVSRQPRTGQTTGPAIDTRTQQTIQVLQPPQERIEFQDFVVQSTGRDLPIFGAELFKNVPSTFAPVDNTPVTSDYVIGPGDEIMIRAWGQLDVDLSVVVDRSGAINIPKVGTINVAGTRYQDLQSKLKTAIGRVFLNFDLNVSLGQLRAIQVFVVGQARSPGAYTVGSMSTLVNAVFAAGGPSAKGSMRSIQLKRGNKVVTELDLYDLLIKGDKSKDAQLLPGDVIYVPPVSSLVAISGSVNVPAIFELKQDGTLAELIAWAGGLGSTASGQKATVERIENHRTRKVAEFKLDAAGMQSNLRNGDLVTIYAVAPRIDNAVTLRGNVAQPGRFPWREGMRVKDLIPRVEALLSRHYWLRKNQTVGLDNTIAELLRRGRAAGVEVSAADLLKKNQLSQQQEADATVAEAVRRNLLALDVAAATTEKIDRQNEVAATSGLGTGQGSQAGELEARTKARNADEIKRNLGEVNWNYAVIERMNPRDLSTTLVPFNLGEAILNGDPAHNLLLQPGDVVTIFSVDDIQVPIASQTKYVRLEGEFVNPGIYRVEPGETLRQLVARVGGLSPNAYLFGAEFTRESNRVYQQKKLVEAVNRLEREIQASAISASKNIISAEDAAGLARDAQAQEALIKKLRLVKATGRIVLELPADETASLKDLPDIALEDSDRFVVPSRPSMVNVIGSVYNENAFVFKPEKRMSDYLRQAGGVSKTGDDGDLYLLRVDGSVISKRQSGWGMSSFDGERIMPGDTIVVPEDFARISWTKTLKDWGTIFYQFGLGAAAIKVLQN
ncbi:MAG: SLBB domain-containing protein [Burkholderiales bacterium]|nr:SLBB domain-containing protein [Burkholderiales bacterium]